VELDGIAVHRVGTRATFGLLARSAFRRRFAHAQLDAVVEDINKVPLFTPWWGRHRVVGVVPHLFGSTAFEELAWPAAAIVWLAERPIPWCYRRVPFNVISQSTADDLVSRGIRRDLIRVVYCGVDSAHYHPDERERASAPLFAYLGRLKKYKRVDLVIAAFARAAIGDATLEIAGAGDYRSQLEAQAAALDLGTRVRFLGRIDEAEKQRLLRRAWALTLTSPKEGWGITNMEAAASGTPVLASNSPGIRESVRDGETGYLLPHADVGALAAAMRRLAADRALVVRLGAAARAFAQGFTWDGAARATESHLHQVLDHRGE
jgi:glycosyltransferase involved in cell wall biosynthesis